MIVQYGSETVRDYVRAKGYKIFASAGVKAIDPGSGACIGCGPGVSGNAGQVTVSAIVGRITAYQPDVFAGMPV